LSIRIPQAPKASRKVRWVDRHGCRPFSDADDWRTSQQAR
jgi:hypothetical protein